MATTPQERALKNYRERLTQRGLARFEVLGLDSDRELIRVVARRLAGNDSNSGKIRAALRNAVSSESPRKGGILAALRRSPMAGADLDVRRSRVSGRPVDL